jgi:phosphonate transport system substrate-binding protein
MRHTPFPALRVLAPLLAACLLLAACDAEEPARRVDLTRREKIVMGERSRAITYAYLPQYAHTVSFRRHHPLIEYLEETTGMAFRQIFPESFAEHMSMVGQGKIDISYSNPFIYVKLNERYGAQAFSRIVDLYSGTDKFRGQIICRSGDTRITELEDVRGKRWIAVDSTSAGGYLFALGHFMNRGIRPEDFQEIAFAPGPGGKQEKVVLSVYAGDYDVGSIREGTLDVMRGQIDLERIRVLDHTRWYPGWVFAARQDLPAEVVDTVRAAMLALNPEQPAHRTILERARMQRIIPSDNADFDPVRELARQIGMDLWR